MFSPAAQSGMGGLFNQREDASIVTRQRVCVCVSTCVCRACVYVVLSAEEASLVLFLAVLLRWSSEGLVGFPPQVSLSPTSPPLTDLLYCPPPPSACPPPPLSHIIKSLCVSVS